MSKGRPSIWPSMVTAARAAGTKSSTSTPAAARSSPTGSTRSRAAKLGRVLPCITATSGMLPVE